MKQNKKRLVRRFPIFVVLVGILWYWCTFRLSVTRVEIRDEKIRQPLTVVLFSDLHGAQFGKDNRRLIRAVLRQQPDLVAVTGDLFTYGDAGGMERAVALLGSLAEEVPVYYVNGEHDNNQQFFDELAEAGVVYLDYETVAFPQANLTLYGISNVYYSPTFDLHNAFSIDESRFNLLLAHQQNLPAFREFGVDLALCGDTHGGQVRLPGIGPVYCDGVWFPGKGCPSKGQYSSGETELVITGGLGNYPVPLRLGNPPEIVVISLLPK